jgi:hypothetical protein
MDASNKNIFIYQQVTMSKLKIKDFAIVKSFIKDIVQQNFAHRSSFDTTATPSAVHKIPI